MFRLATIADQMTASAQAIARQSTKYIFVFNAFVALLVFESTVGTAATFYHDPVQTTIEQVLAADHDELHIAHGQANSPEPVTASVPWNHGSYLPRLQIYDLWVAGLLLNHPAVEQNCQLTLLQLCNGLHRSSDEVPFPLS